ncbi:MAG: metallophosphoesterase [Agathobacter sp.]|nr:metallophosphoesterase [Agathobacter sp.]
MFLGFLLIIWVVWGNTALELNEYKIKSERLPENFDGFRIVQISDLHNAEMGEDNVKLLDMIETADPDIIAITGDMIDHRKTDVEIALQFAAKAVEIAPCYYVTGNHEACVPRTEYLELEQGLVTLGVHVLHDEEIFLEKDGQSITLVGMDDPTFQQNFNGVRYNMTSDGISSLFSGEEFHILLSHRPEFFSEYVGADVDLVLSGHAHGGQFRLPFIGGLAAPNQGLFPKYDAGVFTEGNTNMVVSRGIGNSIFPFRFNNRPEIILIELGR